MSVVKSNVCKMCGGLLDIDLDRQVYICPFCGVTFDYEYFREDNVLGLAKKAMRRKEFGAARDAYEYMLKKDPHNFEALRGLFLIDCNWNTMSPLLAANNVHLTEKNPALTYAIDMCLPEHKEYFGKIREALSVLKDIRRSSVDLTNLEQERGRNQTRLRQIRMAQAENSERFSNGVRSFVDTLMMDDEMGKLAALPVYFGFLILLGIGAAIFYYEAYWLLLVIFGIIVAIIAIYNIRKIVIDNSLEGEAIPVKEKIAQLEKNIDDKRKEINDFRFKYNQLAKEVVTTYPITDMEATEENEEEDTTDADKRKGVNPMKLRRPNRKNRRNQSGDFPSLRKMS
ncbi:hypothetical protein SAMN02910264_01204 [Ruminococcaceae bacterium YAD3003]|nr:hypothetical protein SAMN02910264_01204 [Ruminococcaceae bacterium YAD3003]